MTKDPDHTKGRSKYQCERILSVLAKQPSSSLELAEAIHLVRDGVNIHLRAMKRNGLIHVSGYRHNPKGGRRAPVYSVGKGPDAEFRRARTPTRHLIVDETKRKIVKLVTDRAMSARQIAAALGKTPVWTRDLIRELRMEKRLHIGDHCRTTCGPCPLYQAGDKPDVARVTMTSTESGRRIRAKKALWAAVLAPQQIPERMAATHQGHLPDEPVRIFRQAA